MQHTILVLADRFAVCRLEATAPVPAWAWSPGFSCVTRTSDELSIVCAESSVPEGVRREDGWRCFRVAGALDLSSVGVLDSILAPLAKSGVSVFAVSTFDTDYVLVREADLERTMDVLGRNGHTIAQM